MEEETQEAAELYAEPYRCPATNKNEYCRHDIISAFNNGANWQAERMYSEEDLRNAFKAGREGDMVINNESPKYWDFDTYLQSLLTTTT